MSRYYAEAYGKAKTKASRCGTAASGIETFTASWHGAVRVHIQPRVPSKLLDKMNKHPGEEDQVTIEFVPWRGHGVSTLLYRGPWPAPSKE